MPVEETAPRIQSQFAAILDDSEEAAALLKRADEAVRREDWKLAIDSLQRIVEMPGDGVLRVDDRTYESARRHAQRRIAALPAAGLAAYRLLHDGEAEAMYRRAIEVHDETGLRAIVDRFLLTSYGDRAADVLAGWWLDEGHAAAAAGLLRDLKDIYPDSRIPRSILDAKLALAIALAGQPRAAEAMAEAWPTTGTNATPSSLEARLQRLRSTLGDLRPISTEAPETWPMVMGGPTRAGLMPPVEPTLFENSPWRAALPHEAPGPLDDLYAYQQEIHTLPVMQPVTDGRVIVVKCEDRLMALDAETFDPIWRAAPPLPRTAELSRRQVALQWAGVPVEPGSAAAMERSRRAAALYLDYVDGSVTLSHGLALTLSRSAEASAYLSEILARRPEANLFIEDGRTIANQLLAYDLQTGRIRWRSGGSEAAAGKAADPSAGPGERLTGPVEFLAPPVPVGEGLLVPYRSAGDLYAAVLDPSDGSPKRRVYLCGLGSGVVNSFEALHPCVADGIAYIPTGRGMLIALDTVTWSIRWAVRYETGAGPSQRLPRAGLSARSAQRAAAQGGWLCSPPIATAGRVLLAPADADYLYAFDCARGGVAWQVDRGDSLYLLGADARHAWVVGSGVTQIDLETGRRTWRQEVGIPTGRGAISGDRLYLPTAEYIAVYDAATGRPMGRLGLSPGHPAFGNLLCWDGGLYTCDPGEIRRFPDMVRAYERAVAAHRKAPSESSSAIRLAWLEMLRDQPGRALEALGGVRMEGAPEDPRAA
ncbi:MAG TPA: PQQ-binding-like beta-propeller repeat protein, partial [Phycisphaerae bacterium]|nr:PQQ-binding-like beta-propeller repeat protein [Phycisphaerae bacterium]